MSRSPVASARAIVLDVDGTLYNHRWLRLAMAWRLGRYCASTPLAGLVVLRIVRAYRRAQETLRLTESGDEGLDAAQIRMACESTGCGEQAVRAVVDRWMMREPLPLLRRHLRPGIAEFLREAARRGVRTAVFSDYPARDKLDAVGMGGLFEVVVCAQDRPVGRFKPDPRGLRHVAQRLGIAPGETVYVGDRPDVDVPAAVNAGMECVIIGQASPPRAEWIGVRDFHELTELLHAR